MYFYLSIELYYFLQHCKTLWYAQKSTLFNYIVEVLT